MNEQPTHLDLFSGIGGFALAAGWAGFRTIGFCEIEPYCQAILKKHWPQVPIHPDIRKLRGGGGGNLALLTGGFPCQPFSVAGKRRGKEDHRHLWQEMLRVIKEARPAWVLGENVVGIVNMELDQVCSDLEAEGYAVWPLVIPACAVDAPHRRDRVWIVGNSKFNGHSPSEKRPGLLYKSEKQTREIEERQSSGASSSSENVADSKCDAEGGTHRENEWRSKPRWENQNVIQRNEMGSNSSDSSEDVADTISQRGCGWNPEGQYAENAGQPSRYPGNNGSRMASWLAEPSVGRVANGIRNRSHRIKGLGNAIVPQVAYQIIKGIKEVMDKNGEN